MKRATAAIAAALILSLSLTACAPSAPSETEPSPTPLSVETEAPKWTSAGRPYKQTRIPGDADSVFAVFSNGGDYYELIMRFCEDGRDTYELVKNSSDVIYSPEGAYISRADGGENGIWLCLMEQTEAGPLSSLRLISYSGEEQLSLPLSELGLEGLEPRALCCGNGGVFLGSAELVAFVDGEGRLAASIPVASGGDSLLPGGDGLVYLAQERDGKTHIGELGLSGVSPVTSLSVTGARFFGGNGEFPLVYAAADGLYGVLKNGESSPIAIWRDCGVSFTGVRYAAALPDGAFLIEDSLGASLLSPADISEMRSAVTLTVASLGSLLYGQELVFNSSGAGYYVEINDYSEGGAVSREDALKRLGTEIISGSAPDMLLLDGMPVHTYINKGYLAPLGALMDADADFSREDVAIAKQLTISGDIYFLGRSFAIDTRLALASRVGDVYGWTTDEYLRIESELPPGAEMLYNNTRPDFFRALCARYISKAVDLQNGTCDFDNAEFIALLKAAGSIRETPEPTDVTMIDFTPHDERLREGTLCAAAYMVGSVTALECYEARVGAPIAPVGMPTPDGSCGSELILASPIGIFSASDHIDGCWEFIKFLLKSYEIGDVTQNSSLPVYAPYLDREIDIARSTAGEDGQPLLSEDGAARFRDFLSAQDGVALYDETVLSIITSEASAYFAGAKSAEECAAAIQSRVSIYAAEQA